MKASIIIPALNEEKYIEKCLESLSQQTLDEKYEIIVADGYSTDKTVEIAEKYTDKVVFEKKPTISAGRQKAAEVAKGKILVSTDADIKAPKTWLQQILSNFKNHKVVASHGLIVPYDGTIIEKTFCHCVFPTFSELMVMINKPSPPGSNFAVRRKTFQKAGGFNPELTTGEDVELASRVKHFGKFKFDREAIIYVSIRRLRGWGYLRYVSYYTSNYLRVNFTGNGRDDYDRIR